MFSITSGGAGGIRTLDRALQPYNGLANRRLQPLGHSSISADMPDARASRKRQIQITPRPFRGAGALPAFLTNRSYPISRDRRIFPGFAVPGRRRAVPHPGRTPWGLTSREFSPRVGLIPGIEIA